LNLNNLTEDIAKKVRKIKLIAEYTKKKYDIYGDSASFSSEIGFPAKTMVTIKDSPQSTTIAVIKPKTKYTILAALVIITSPQAFF
jgi:hypothetical protein